MSWGIGDLGSTIDLRYEMQGAREGTLEAEEQAGGTYLLVRGVTHLTEDDIEQILTAEMKADIWNLPPHLPRAEDPPTNEKGIQSVLICYSNFNLAETRHNLMKAIDRDCQEDKGSLAAEVFARDMIRVAQRHFPDIGKSKLWQNELNESLTRH